MTIFERSVDIKASPQEVFEFHLRPANLARLMPPFIRSEIVAPSSPSRAGDTQTIVIRLPFIALKWDAAITKVGEGLLEDVQVSGPFRSWRHEHRVEDIGGGGAPGPPRPTRPVAGQAPPSTGLRPPPSQDSGALPSSWAPRPQDDAAVVSGGKGNPNGKTRRSTRK